MGKQLCVKFTDAQREAITLLSKRDKRSLADTIRMLVDQACRQRGADIRRVLDADEPEELVESR